MTPESRVETRVRIASVLGMLGLAVEAWSFYWRHPLAFVVFAAVAPALVLGGIAAFFLSLIGGGPKR